MVCLSFSLFRGLNFAYAVHQLSSAKTVTPSLSGQRITIGLDDTIGTSSRLVDSYHVVRYCHACSTPADVAGGLVKRLRFTESVHGEMSS